jgi:hypothetical protein
VLGNGLGPGQGLISNQIYWDGGELDGSSLTIGMGHSSSVVVGDAAINSQGTLGAMYVGYDYTGTYTQAAFGCQVMVTNQMIVGDCVAGVPATVELDQGTLYVTNPMHTAVLDIRNGTFILNYGATLVVDHLILTNACGRFRLNGGTIITNSPATLDPNLDADGDGLSNSLEKSLGMDPLNPSEVCAPFGIVAWWPGTSSSMYNNTAFDVVSGNNGYLNGATFVPGKVGQAFNLDGLSQFIYIPASQPNASKLNVGLGSGFTIELWINPTDVATPRPLVEWSDGADDGVRLSISGVPGGTPTPGCLYANVRSTSSIDNEIVTTGGLVRAGNWQHVALTFDKGDDFTGGLATLYVNGTNFATLNTDFLTPLTSSDLYVGGGVDSFFPGKLDEVSLYNRALSAAEIQNIYIRGSAGKCMPPIYVLSVSVSGNNLNISWLAQPWRIYRVQYTTNPHGSQWTDLTGDIMATSSIANASDVIPTGAPQQRFYRVVMFQ